MCGLVGIWRFDGQPVDERELLRARDRLVNRGPDDAGMFIDGSVGLAHRRLAIIDLSPLGRMPMTGEDSSVWAVFNGEIYNFQALRTELELHGHRFRSQTDSEVIVHAYEQWGTASFARFDGMFAIAIYDRRHGRLVLARDITGEKPLFYSYQPGRAVAFASTLTALLTFSDVPRAIDREAAREYMRFGFVPAPRSIIEGVRKVEPGGVVVIEQGRDPEASTYWSLETAFQSERSQVSLEQATDQLQQLLREVVRSRMVADVPLGAFLSGGIDSSLIVAIMAETHRNVRTFTIGFRDAAFDESEHAHRIAKHLGVENTMLVLSAADVLHELDAVATALDEPMADYSVLPSLAVARIARRHVTVALTGDGADELFGGYRYYGGTQLFERVAGKLPRALRGVVAAQARWLPIPRLRRAVERTAVADAAAYFGRCGFYRGATASGSLARVMAPGGRADADEVVARFVRAHEHGAAEAGMLWDATRTLPNAWLTKLDRTTMEVSLEARAPFLARSVQEYAARLPLHLKIRGAQRKIILRQLLARYVPRELFERPKQGFTAPLRAWFAHELRDELRARVTSSRIEELGVLDMAGVRDVLAEQEQGTVDHTQLLWAIFHLDRWYESAVQASSTGTPSSASER